MFQITLIGGKYMKYFRKFQANKEKLAEDTKVILAKTSQRACPPVWPSTHILLFFDGFVVLLSSGSFWVVNQTVTDDNNKMIDDNKRPFWRYLLHFWYDLGRFSCKNEIIDGKNTVLL